MVPIALQEQLQRAVGEVYDIQREIGAGGMATVFLAHDRKHGREVALKLLDPELGAVLGVERFLAEIQVTAKLQHPNLLPLFDSGAADGLLYYVMPFVAGESLRARIERERQLPVDDAVRIAVAIANALDYAHRQGVIHRDLKPENILLHEGQPLVADFGIALAVSRAGGNRLTQTGLSLGTPRYMSPEQAAGDRAVDARSDVYSLACVLYEMLAGDPPHTGSNVQAVIAKVLTEPVTSVRVHRPSVSVDVEAALDRALAKIPGDRFQTAREFGDALAGRSASGSMTHGTFVRHRAGRRWLGASLVAASAIAVAATAVAVALWSQQRNGAVRPASRFVLSSTTDDPLAAGTAITPDGRNVIYPGSGETRHPLLVRALDQLTPRVLAGTEGALNPFVSPDGRWVGFFTTDDKLKKVPIDGGPVVVLANSWRFGSAAWGSDNVIVFDVSANGALAWIPSEGGEPRAFTRPDTAAGEGRHRSPLVLPDHRAVVFTVERMRRGLGGASGELALVRLDEHSTGISPHKRLGIEGRAIAYRDGWLIYAGMNDGQLLASRLDLERDTIVGVPVTLLQESGGALHGVSLAENGTLLYIRNSVGSVPMVVDERGTVQPLLQHAAPGAFMNPRVSPDGRRLALQSATARTSDIWIYDVATGTATRLTSGSSAFGLTWSPDGRNIIFAGSGATEAAWRQPADGSGPAVKFLDTEGIGNVFTPDGSTLLFARQVQGRWGIWAANLQGDHSARPLFTEPFDANMPAISPDGRWLAYASAPANRQEIFLRPFPGPGSPIQISSAGGTEPAWSADGRRIFYRAERTMMAATLSFQPTPAVTSRAALFRDSYEGEMPHRNFDVLPGNRFVMIGAAGNIASEYVIVMDWLPELRKILAGSKPRDAR